jgi:hypothetical protein
MSTKPVPATDKNEKTISVNVEGKSCQVVIQRHETTTHILDRLNLKGYQLSMGPSTPQHTNVLNAGDIVFDNVVENEGLVATAVPPVGRPMQPLPVKK